MKTQILIGILFLGTLLVSCSKHPSADSASLDMESYEPLPITKKGAENMDVPKKLIQTGDIRFQSENLDSSKALLLEAVKNNSGYISSERALRGSNDEEYIFEIRIPQSNFNRFLSEATRGVENFDKKLIEVEDVTEKFIDLKTRLKTKKALEKRYLELLDKSKSVSEILEVEKELNQLRADIESVEGRFKYLSNQVTLSTINIAFYKEISASTDFGKKFKSGISNGWQNLVIFLVFLINIWPFILIAIGLFFGIKYLRKKRN